MRFKSFFVLFLVLTMFTTSIQADMIVETAPIGGTASDISYLDKSVRSVGQDVAFGWASSYGISSDDLQQPCTWSDFLSYLWRLNGAVDYGDETQSIITWAVNRGMAPEQAIRNQLYNPMRHGDAQWALWQYSGCPAPSSTAHMLPIGEHDAYELWSCDIGLIVREEQVGSDPYVSLTKGQALLYLYYYYHRRSETSFPITVDQFLASCQHVVDTARLNGYRYGSSGAVDPTTDGIISCDRMIAKALYDLGYTDQPRGGITCGNADRYLSAWGFERSESLSAAKRGSIMLVKHNGKNYISHMFVFASNFDLNSMTGDRYDCGSNSYIQSQQPIRNVGFWYRTDDVIVYNIPG